MIKVQSHGDPRTLMSHRWIEAEREEALLGKRGPVDGESSVAHEAEAFLSLGHGPRICPGQVRSTGSCEMCTTGLSHLGSRACGFIE